MQRRHQCCVQALHAAPLQRRPGIPGPPQRCTGWPRAPGVWARRGLPRLLPGESHGGENKTKKRFFFPPLNSATKLKFEYVPLFTQNLSYGQTKEFNCEHCHSKLSILAESTKFQFIPPRSNKAGQSSYIRRVLGQKGLLTRPLFCPGPGALTVNYKVRDPAVQKGKPLPEKGTCRHYKQSHRWLRYHCLRVVTWTPHGEMMEAGIYVLSGSPAVAGLTPVTCATMRTRTTPWNWPPGWFVATAPKNRSAKDLVPSAPFPLKFPGTFNTRSFFTWVKKKKGPYKCGGGVRADVTADSSTDKVKGGKNDCYFWLVSLGSLQPYGNAKPCVTCGSMMTRGTRSSHWEGGLGCRNKTKMSR